MDPASDTADLHEVGEDAPLLGPSVRAFGKAALVVYWIVCLGVIAFGLSQMEWRWPPAKAAHGQQVKPARSVPTLAPSRPVAPLRPAPPRAPPQTRAVPAPERARPREGISPSPLWWAAALALFSISGVVVLVARPRRRRGSRGLARFSGRGRRLGSLR